MAIHNYHVYVNVVVKCAYDCGVFVWDVGRDASAHSRWQGESNGHADGMPSAFFLRMKVK